MITSMGKGYADARGGTSQSFPGTSVIVLFLVRWQIRELVNSSLINMHDPWEHACEMLPAVNLNAEN